MAISVRIARLGDGAGIARVWLEAAAYYAELDAEHFKMPVADGLAERTDDQIGRSGDRALSLVAEMNGRVVGWLSARVEPPFENAARWEPPVLGGLLETQFKEIEADSGPKGIKKRIERPPIIDEKDLPSFEVRNGALDGSADRADLGIVFMFTYIEFTVRRLLGRRDVTRSLKSLVGDNRSSKVENLLHLAF